MSSSVQRLAAELLTVTTDDKVVWWHSGGGCFALRVSLGELAPNGEPRDYLFITDYHDTFSDADFESDDERHGWRVGRYVWTFEGFAIAESDVVMYGRPEVYSTPNLEDGIAAVVAVVAAEMQTTIREDKCRRCQSIAGTLHEVEGDPALTSIRCPGCAAAVERGEL